MYILGINAYHADASAVLLRDGETIAAVEEERFRRVKHWAGFPTRAIAACLDMGGIDGSAIEHVAFGRRPTAHVWRKVLAARRLLTQPGFLHERARNSASFASVRERVTEALGGGSAPKIHFVEHHAAHLASTFFPSPYDEAAVCAVDGFGDFVSTSVGLGRRNTLALHDRVFFPHSLGILYTAVTQYLGFTGYGDEFKIMGLAPYGKPTHVRELRELVRLTANGKFELDLRYFTHHTSGAKMVWEDGYPHLDRLFSPEMERLLGPARDPSTAVSKREEDLAASVQVVFEEALWHILRALHARTRTTALCLAGGCGMNSVANGKIRTETPFTDVYVQPAAADNGTALGAALWAHHVVLGRTARHEMRHGYWGTQHDATVSRDLARGAAAADASLQLVEFDSPEATCAPTAQLIADGNVIGWYQGRMEWGARALGNRSILADPRRIDMRDIINVKIKFRERFRPFAPSILESAVDEYFEGAAPDPFMQTVYPVRPEKRAIIPAVTHVDGSGRLQTVSASTNALYHRLISAFHELTQVPVLLNTSFNENEPIVETPAQALDCFLRTRMDVLVMDHTMLIRRRAEDGP